MIRVLVVDDDFMVAKLHSTWVARTPGFQVVGVAHTGAQALQAVADAAPDLLLLDVYLPDLTGLEVLSRLRAEGRLVDALMVTAASDAPTVQQALRGGAFHYVVKPFEYDTLRERLQQYAARSTRLAGALDGQSDVDAVFGAGGGERVTRTTLPKGVTAETVRLVTDFLATVPGTSAAECGTATGLSRVSARRYLEHLVGTGRATVSLRYGTAGRPERRYRATAGGDA